MTSDIEDELSKGLDELDKIKTEFERMLGIKPFKPKLSLNDLTHLGLTPNEAKALLKRLTLYPTKVNKGDDPPISYQNLLRGSVTA